MRSLKADLIFENYQYSQVNPILICARCLRTAHISNYYKMLCAETMRICTPDMRIFFSFVLFLFLLYYNILLLLLLLLLLSLLIFTQKHKNTRYLYTFQQCTVREKHKNTNMFKHVFPSPLQFVGDDQNPIS